MVAGGNLKIGVLGGIGPEATGIFYIKLIRRLQKEGLIKRNTDFPHIVINSIPAPELIFESFKEEDLIPYINGLKELDSFGVDFITIICNTLYLYRELLQKSVKTPIIDLREALRKVLKNKGIKKITVLGTPLTVKCGLYKFKEIDSIDITNKELEMLSEIIFNFNRGVDKTKQKRF